MTDLLRSRQSRRLSLLPARDLSPRERRKDAGLFNHAEPERPPAGSIYLAISNAIVGVLREYTGRGPMKARTTTRENVVVVMLEQTLTKGERVLVDKGRGDRVLALRREYQEAMREAGGARIAELTGRPVLAMMSANHIDPDLAPRSSSWMGHPSFTPRRVTRTTRRSAQGLGGTSHQTSVVPLPVCLTPDLKQSGSMIRSPSPPGRSSSAWRR